MFNGLELAGNFLNGGLLRPVYKDSTRTTPANTPLNSNLVSSPAFTDITQVAAGFCIGCHNAHVVLLGDDPTTREIPELPGVGAEFRPDLVRPLRDYHFVDAAGRQILPDTIGARPLQARGRHSARGRSRAMYVTTLRARIWTGARNETG